MINSWKLAESVVEQLVNIDPLIVGDVTKGQPVLSQKIVIHHNQLGRDEFIWLIISSLS